MYFNTFLLCIDISEGELVLELHHRDTFFVVDIFIFVSINCRIYKGMISSLPILRNLCPKI
jgi:hypothetical protein